MTFLHDLVLLLTLSCTALAYSIPRAANPLVPYAPVPGLCPSTALVRTADGLSAAEQAWFDKKKPKADAALQSWLGQFGTFNATSFPTIGSALAGGYLRASLLAAGIHQQLDGGEGSGEMAGLLQAISYETTLSGSTAFQGALIQNNWPTIASLSDNIWQPNYVYGFDILENPTQGPTAAAELVTDVGTKSAAGYPTTLIDLYGRLIGYSSLYSPQGGIDTLMSDAQTQSNFANADVPFPIFTSIGSTTSSGGVTCIPGTNGTQYELTPFEFGSWDPSVAAFMDMKYLGTSMNAGKPVTPLCTTGFDNIGFMMGTSANVIVDNCKLIDSPAPTNNTSLNDLLAAEDGAINYDLNHQYYSSIPNPFFGMSSSPQVSELTDLALVDGGNSGQVIPLWPLLERSSIDVTFVWDNYYDVLGVGTSGGQFYDTYVASIPANLDRMPVVPDTTDFEALGLNTKPTVFGCDDVNKQTMIYVPVQEYIPQTSSTFNLSTTPEQTRNFITNGNLLATNNNNTDWPRCVACFIMKKAATSLPSFCDACYTQYCYN